MDNYILSTSTYRSTGLAEAAIISLVVQPRALCEQNPVQTREFLVLPYFPCNSFQKDSPQPVKIDLNKKLDPKQKTMQKYNIDDRPEIQKNKK